MDLYLDAAEKFVTDLFNQFCDDTFLFHNLLHTQRVAERSLEIAGYEGISRENLQILNAAAWFHDTGYLFEIPTLHEYKSVEIMLNFYSGKNIPEEILTEIKDCILSTKFPVNPQTLLQSILCDADTFHFGTPEFSSSNENVYLEFRIRNDGPPKPIFTRGTIAMLEKHRFYTSYCKAILTKGKEENMAWLINTSKLY